MKESWDLAVDENDLERLIESMPRRIRSVYEAGGEAGGGYTKYEEFCPKFLFVA